MPFREKAVSAAGVDLGKGGLLFPPRCTNLCQPEKRKAEKALAKF